MTHLHTIGCCTKRKPRDITKASPGFRLRPTWLQKAAEPGPEHYEWLHEVADAYGEKVAQAFLEAVKDHARKSVDMAKLRAALDREDIDAVMAILGVEKNQAALQPALLGNLQNVVHQAGQAALHNTPALARPGGAQLAMRFDMVNPHTVQQVRNYGFNLINQVNDDTRNGIRQIVADAMEFGGHPYEQARQIKGLIGLTESQANSVANFRRLLMNRDSRALQRELRDHRFDRQVRRVIDDPSAEPLSPEQINTMVDRYATRALANRAEVIARTETINAARIGTQNAWVQAAEHGLLDRGTVRQGWMVTPDDRLCVYCEAVPDMNPDGVPLGQQFQTPLGPVDGPTLHPQCFPGETLVSINAKIRAVTRRWFDGYLCVFRTSAGNEIACTPNHPILTDRGWVGAKSLVEGDNLIGGAFNDGFGFGGAHHENAPTPIHEIAESFGRSADVAPVPVPLAAEHFHGDGKDSDVAIIWADGLLGRADQPSGFKHFKKRALPFADIANRIGLEALRGLELAFQRNRFAAGGGMGGAHLALAGSGAHLGPFQSLGLGSTPRHDAILGQNTVDDVARDAVMARQLQNGSAGQVARQKIVQVWRKPFSGHVYNLETDDGWYCAGGIIVHNCRCVVYIMGM